MSSLMKESSAFEETLRTNSMNVTSLDALDAKYMEKLSGKDSVICDLTRAVHELDNKVSSLTSERNELEKKHSLGTTTLEMKLEKSIEKNHQLSERLRLQDGQNRELTLILEQLRQENSKLRDSLDKSVVGKAELEKRFRHEKSQLVLALGSLSEKHSELLSVLENSSPKGLNQTFERTINTVSPIIHGPVLKEPSAITRVPSDKLKSTLSIQNRLQALPTSNIKNFGKRLRKK